MLSYQSAKRTDGVISKQAVISRQRCEEHNHSFNYRVLLVLVFSFRESKLASCKGASERRNTAAKNNSSFCLTDFPGDLEILASPAVFVCSGVIALVQNGGEG